MRVMNRSSLTAPMRAVGLGLVVFLAACATNGELGFAGHPADCAMGIGHSDCAPGTPGAERYALQGPTVFQDSLATVRATGAVPRLSPAGAVARQSG